MAKREPIVKNKGEGPDNLMIEGAGEFNGRPDGKTSGRGMLGLISAIPPAPNLPNVRGVRMLAPTVPSLRPSGIDAAEQSLPPIGLPDEERARDAGGHALEDEGDEHSSNSDEPAEESDDPEPARQLQSAEPEGKPVWVRFATLLIIALALGSIPVLAALLTGD